MVLGIWEPILVSFIALVTTWVAIIVFFNNPKNKGNQIFTLLCFSILTWILSAFVSELPKDLRFSLLLSKFAFFGVLLSAVFLFYFSYFFPVERTFKKFPTNLLVGGLTLLFSFLIFKTSLIIKKIFPIESGFSLEFGSLYFPYVVFCVFLVFYAFKNFLKTFKASKGVEKLQLQYLLLGLLIFAGATIIVNVIIRQIVGSDVYYRIGNYSVLFFVILVAAAITRYHLFGIQVILTELLVVTMMFLLLIQIFIASTLFLKIVNGLTFLLFSLFGWLLIKYTFKEIERREELERLNKLKTEFVAIASHQLRTPLSILKGFLSMLLEGIYGKLPEKGKEVIEKCFLANERLINLVESLLKITKIEAGKIELEMKKENLGKLIEEIIQEMEIKAKEKSLYLIFERPKEKIPPLLIDKEKMREAILNLIDNGIKYTKEGGIKVSLEKKNEKVVLIKVKDTGEGMEKEELEKIFQIFSRGEAGKELFGEGLGLGLYFSKKIVELHKGKLWAESEGKGKGSTFYVELPIR